MKTMYKILIPVIVFLIIGLFYLYVVANDYSGYIEGIVMTFFHETDADKILVRYSHLSGVTKITDADLKDVPRIKGMLDIAFDQKFPLYDDGFSLFDENLNSYWLNQEGQDIRIQIGMSYEDTEYYGNWLSENFSGRLIKYNDKYFMFGEWIA